MSKISEVTRRILGCGSNLIDIYHHVTKFPAVGTKTLFSPPVKSSTTAVHPFPMISCALPGGVVMNQLAWASLMGGSTFLLGCQGTDPYGVAIRDSMKSHQISLDYVQVSDEFETSISYVFIENLTGERTIIMHPGSTGRLSSKEVKQFWSQAFRPYDLFTTEISQLPLQTVTTLMELASKASTIKALDVDILPSYACDPLYGLGNPDQFLDCVTKADVIKLGFPAAKELLQLLSGNRTKDITDLSSLAGELQRKTGSKLVVVTHSDQGAALTTTRDNVVVIESNSVIQNANFSYEIMDTTGAGDAFMGGLLAHIAKHGLPESRTDLVMLGELAVSCGFLCCTQLGAQPADKVQILSQKNVLIPEKFHVIM